jgi:hypothetical protein
MSWIEDEFSTLDLGDRRLDRRAMKIAEALSLAPGKTIPQSFHSRADIKACYNFYQHDDVTEEKLLTPHFSKTIERITQCKVVLFPSDTTEIDFTSKNSMVDRQRLTNTKQGIWLHSTIAVTPERLMLGSVEANFWERNPEKANKNRTIIDKAPIEEKESYRWLQGYRTACKVAREAPETQIVSLFDREGDIIEIYAESEAQKKLGVHAHFIVRSNHDRQIENLNDKGIEDNIKLRKKLKNSPSLGNVEFVLQSRGNRKARKVQQQLKAASVVLTPKNKKNIKVKVNVVMCEEINFQDGETPITWMFITDLPINTFSNVELIVKYYLCRWEIETFFKVLKSGCKIEERQLHSTTRMRNLISLFLILAWRIMYTMMMGRICSEMSSGDLFEDAEWKSVCKIFNRKKSLPRKPPPLGEFILMIASLGGYVYQKNGDPPGVKTMWKGMARMLDFAIAWEAFGS